ncbi:TIGR03620 family F420-dependent LLM class oxidoreductase [Microbacterium sp. ZXX196]|uniref:TIGR03620 family F420-dependent LLM class oxidoreductase n=1 Tax=Microbacterium sp. ZXX196 TaxID=2609291 RepID=UPI0012B83EBA|nr:TIGR03620 family F420-dependent LLM class oxidoreductase [Microbacterium sp. ZXX196]MTE24804.1 TIGR03620 family F420-dependent LLM class oxidoreductase [Microbacterium sp. ZXX196]
MARVEDFGTYGVWLWESAWTPGVAAVAERLGYTTLWIGGSPDAELASVEAVLNETERVVVATGIVNIWQADPVEVAASYLRITDQHPGRFVVGIGSGHREATPERVRPLAALGRYLDVFDAEGVPPEQRLLAALGDKTLALAAERTLGAHPYLTTPAHTAHAKKIVGERLLAPELKVSLAATPDEARATARAFLDRYLRLENYVGALKRFGASEADVSDGGSDALIDLVAANPTAAAAAAGIGRHLAAGATHVGVQPLGADILGSLERVADAVGLTDGA